MSRGWNIFFNKKESKYIDELAENPHLIPAFTPFFGRIPTLPIAEEPSCSVERSEKLFIK